jgi:nucleoside-diphosphate-sugar epimerase
MTLLLVGATGFLGCAVAARLVDRDLVVLARKTGDRRWLPAGACVREGDLDDEESVRTALVGVDTLIWCASMGFGHVPRLMPAIQAAGVERAIFVSTTAIFTSLPARSRATRMDAERAVNDSCLAWTIVRPTMIYGSARDRNISRLLRFLRRSPIFAVVGSGDALQQPIFVDDLAEAIVATLDTTTTEGQSYNLGGAAPLRFVDLVRVAGQAVGRVPRLMHVPVRLALTLARLAARLPGGVRVTPEQIQRLAEDKAFDLSDAVRDFGFRARGFDEGVRLEARMLGLAPVDYPMTR